MHLDGYGWRTSGGRDVVYRYIHPVSRKEMKELREYESKRQAEKIEREDEIYEDFT